ncbi:phospholipase D/nuclease [Patellaria atrata CBS 101060]|uniref:Phospholipase D/nuclease n=1 Tax=Patellaria atrata CBS 101060 TaxID=1346257 RepID=A0A9P4S3L8_9PEZI|nr:phospholipase D/nuclease [Patellaria atrata CBS 101060]
MDFQDEDDNELQRAIQLSLEQTYELGNLSTPLLGDGALRASVKAEDSLRTTTPSNTHSQQAAIDLTEDSQHSNNSSKEISPAPSTFLLNRKALEQERLARVAGFKRRATTPPTLHQQSESRKLARLNDMIPEDLAKELQYPRGVIKKTWVRGQDRNNDIKIEEVFRKDELKTAVLSSFQWDMNWVLSKVDCKKTKIIFVLEAKDARTRNEYMQAAKGLNICDLRLCFPPMVGEWGCMHSKLMLLFYADSLRVVVPSANLVSYDWGETGVMENTVFLIDLPRYPDGHFATDEELTPFSRNLLYFLEAMGLDESARKGVLKFDFQNTQHLGFVHSIPGSHQGDALKRTGSPGLGEVVRKLGIDTSSPVQVDSAFASLGAINNQFLKDMYSAIKGEGKTSYETDRHIKDHFRVHFPTRETVRKSRGGVNNGGTICFQSNWYNSISFPKDILRDYKSRRDGILSHNKMLFVRGVREGKRLAWVYTGSSNLSASAWGRRMVDRATGYPRLTVRNWECGVVVVIPPKDLVEADPAIMTTVPDLEVFEGEVDIPFEAPGEEYDGKKPWFFME